MKLGMCGFTIGAAAYMKQFPVVEAQQTFYDPPPLATLERWRARAPESVEALSCAAGVPVPLRGVGRPAFAR